jgi:aryl-alcohol dehydrogenase
MRITAAVARAEGGPFTIEELELDEPRPDEILVDVHAVGLCQADIAIRDQFMPLPLPAVLGHEGAGVVAEVGCDVTKVAPGDKVLMTFDACGDCALCLSGHPAYCLELVARNVGGGRPDGTNALHDGHGDVHGFFFGQSSFATHALATERTVVKLGDSVDLDLVAPLGCGVVSGAGTVLNRLRAEPGSSMAVFGTGTVGMSAIMAAKDAGCTDIYAVDIQPDRLALALELGATAVIDASRVNPVSEIQWRTGIGVSYTIDTTAVPEVARQAVDCLAPLGTCALLGLGPAGTEVSVDLTNLLIPGRTVVGVTKGDCRPDEFVPQLLDLHVAGRLPFDRLVDVYPLADINKAVEDAEMGKCVKPVLKPSL